MKYRAAEVIRQREEQCRADGYRQARRLAEMLRREFGIQKVYLFGSLVSGSGFRRNSDIDLAVVGLAHGYLFRAVGKALRQSDWDVDIKPFEELPPHWQDEIRNTGETL